MVILERLFTIGEAKLSDGFGQWAPFANVTGNLRGISAAGMGPGEAGGTDLDVGREIFLAQYGNSYRLCDGWQTASG